MYIIFNKYSWNGDILKGFSVTNESLEKFKYINSSFYSIALDYNASFLSGLCYICDDNALLEYHGISDSLIDDIKKGLLGQSSNAFLKHSKYENLINILGLLYIIYNIKKNEKIDEVVNIYSAIDFKINKGLH